VGRTLKDVFVRFRALQATTSGYQNGYDCQVSGSRSEWSKELGLNSKREIEESGWRPRPPLPATR